MAGTRVAVYVRQELYDALRAYRGAGVEFNMSKFVQECMVDRFVEVERARRALGEPHLYTPDQLASMKRLLTNVGKDGE